MSRTTRFYSPETRAEARRLRQAGQTYREISDALGGIPKNTISGWVADIRLTNEQQARIRQIELEARARGRLRAAEWHREQRRQRLRAAEEWAAPLAERLSQDGEALMLMAAALWLGEGAREEQVLKLGNSDPRIIRGWLSILRLAFEIDESKLAAQLALTEGMPESELRTFWSEVTGIPQDRFNKSSIKAGPAPREREGYKGVCVVIYYSSDLRRRIGALAFQVLERLGSSSG